MELQAGCECEKWENITDIPVKKWICGHIVATSVGFG